MREAITRNPLAALLKECYIRPHPRCKAQQYSPSRTVLWKRSFASTPSLIEHEVNNVAVLGGGISGLASAFYLSEKLPNAKITIYEASPRLGGWLQSQSVDVGTGKIVFEQGPRTLRPSVPNGMATLDLIKRLGLEGEVITTPKTSVAAQNRFVYYPDHIVRMPGPGMSVLENLSNIWSEPIFEGLLGSVLVEPFKSRPEGLEDESVGSFLSRRFSTSIVDNIVSAVLHGIYAGDVYRLSAVSLLPKLWLYERSSGSILDAAFQAWTRGEQTVPINDPLFMSQIAPEMIDGQGNPLPGTEVFEDIRKSSVFTFRGGIGRLAEEIEQALEDKPNVLIKKNTPVKSIRLVSQEATSQVELQSQTSGTQQESQAPEFYSHVISTISSKHLNIMTQPTDCLSPFAETHSVTVMVVNLYFSSIDLLPVHGFGYLLPRSLPFDQNPERALGVVFDSDATIGQDTGEGTKLTVMLGGHWWDNWDRYPDEEEGARMAKAVLRRHLGIKEEPEAVRVGLQRECIPQYTVGHSKRMEKAHEKLLKAFGGRLRVAGSSYTGVGLNDCVRSGFDTVMGMVSGRRLTGLEHFVGGAKWAILPKGQKLGWPKVLKT